MSRRRKKSDLQSNNDSAVKAHGGIVQAFGRIGVSAYGPSGAMCTLSGRGDLSGLRGEGGFEGDFGKGSDGTLDYWFE
jgi:hypothetical protein